MLVKVEEHNTRRRTRELALFSFFTFLDDGDSLFRDGVSCIQTLAEFMEHIFFHLEVIRLMREVRAVFIVVIIVMLVEMIVVVIVDSMALSVDVIGMAFGRWPVEVIADTVDIRNHRLFGMHVVDGELLESRRICKNTSFLFLLFWAEIGTCSRRTAEEVSSDCNGGLDSVLWVMVPIGDFLELLCIGKDILALLAEFGIVVLGSRRTREEVPSHSNTCRHGNFGMEIIRSKLLECCSIFQDTCTFFSVFF
mmetsp:Transcript_15555/g.38767  ORF Transcript_15555/g.38767 Transcript_15555/m.38767 type:complete len:251 (+) Transcript_15555:175-927(+)